MDKNISIEFANSIDLIIIAIYFVSVIGIGLYFSKFIKGAGDYFRAGNKMHWWVAAISSWMSGFGAFVFTGLAGMIYLEGLQAALLTTTGLPAMLFAYFFFAKYWRRSRVMSILEYFGIRFNKVSLQISTWFYIPIYVLIMSAGLYSLSFFVGTALHFPVESVILVAGISIAIYTVIGGIWGVVITDTVQFLVLLPVSILMIPLSIHAVGGMDALVANAPAGFWRPFSGEIPNAMVTIPFFLAYLLQIIHGQNTNPIAQRFFSVRNEREAQKTALLTGILFTTGAFFWLVPPVAARILFGPDLGDLIGVDVANSQEYAYILIALKILPHGMMGFLMAAIMAATMSSHSSLYNMLSGMFSKDIYGNIKKDATDKDLLAAGRISSLLMAVIVILGASIFNYYELSIFDIVVAISVAVITPLATPMLLAFVYKKAPSWGALFSFVCSFFAVIICKFLLEPHIDSWGYMPESAFLIFGVAAVSFLISPYIPFLKSTKEEQQKIDEFYKRLATPIQEEEELIPSDVDALSMGNIVGWIIIGIGAVMSFLVALPGLTINERLISLATGSPLLLMGVVMRYFAKKNLMKNAALQKKDGG